MTKMTDLELRELSVLGIRRKIADTQEMLDRWFLEFPEEFGGEAPRLIASAPVLVVAAVDDVPPRTKRKYTKKKEGDHDGEATPAFDDSYRALYDHLKAHGTARLTELSEAIDAPNHARTIGRLNRGIKARIFKKIRKGVYAVGKHPFPA